METVGSGCEALEIAQQKTFNLALLDIKLPDVTGIELIAPLKKLHSDMESIIMTAFSSYETVVRALNEGASGYITKPLNLDDVLNKIDNIFERQRLIADKKKLERDLQYQAILVENVSDAIISTDINLNIKSWNKAAEIMYGWKSTEIIGKPMSEIIPEEVPNDQKEDVKKNIFDKGFWKGEILQKRKDNSRINIFSSATLIKDSAGKIQGVVVINQDITERKKAEGEIVNLAKFPSENPNPVLRVTKSKIIYTNKQGEKIFNAHEGSEVPAVLQEILIKALDANINTSTEITLNNHIFSLDITPISDEEYANVYGRDITEQKRAVEEIRLQGEIMKNMSEGTFLIRAEDGTIVYANPAFEEMFRYDPGEIIGKNVSVINAPTDKSPEKIKDEITKFLLESGEWHGEVKNIKKDSTQFWCYANVSLFDHPKYGTVMVSIHTDITERKKAEEKEYHRAKIMKAINKIFLNALICENEEELGKVCLKIAEELVGAKFGFFGDINEEGNFDSVAISDPGWNACRIPETNALLVIQNMETKGMQFLPVHDGISRIFNDPSNHPDSVGLPEGHPELMNFLGIPIKYRGKITGLIGLGNKEGGFNTSDIEAIETLSVPMTEALLHRRAEDNLLESEERFRRIFESKMIGTIFWNVEGEINDANAAFLDMVGYTKDDILNGILRWSEMTPPEFAEQDIKSLEEIANTGVMTPIEKEYFHKDGTRIPIIIGAASLPGSTLNGVAFILDITQRKKAEAELKKMMKDLKTSNNELEQFAYVASHDLQEPLRMVASFTQLLQDRYKDKLDEDANDFINYAVDGATRMQNLISDLLIFSRVGSRGKAFKKVDMNIVLEVVLNNFRQRINETDTVITNDPLPVIEADETQMIQLFQNLISNAIKFQSDENPRIHVSGETQKNKWIFTIRDNGIGIDTEFFNRIFVIFQRLHKKSDYGGTGIGLAVCKKIVQRHGGKIRVESELGKGSSFHFSIKKKAK